MYTVEAVVIVPVATRLGSMTYREDARAVVPVGIVIALLASIATLCVFSVVSAVNAAGFKEKKPVSATDCQPSFKASTALTSKSITSSVSAVIEVSASASRIILFAFAS